MAQGKLGIKYAPPRGVMSINTERMGDVAPQTTVNENNTSSVVVVGDKGVVDLNSLHEGISLSSKTLGRRVVSFNTTPQSNAKI